MGMTQREIDVLIAEKMFGWRYLTRCASRWFGNPNTIGETDGWGTIREWDGGEADVLEEPWWLEEETKRGEVVPIYTKTYEASLSIVEKLKQKYMVSIEVYPNSKYEVTILEEYGSAGGAWWAIACGIDEELPMAICKATVCFLEHYEV